MYGAQSSLRHGSPETDQDSGLCDFTFPFQASIGPQHVGLLRLFSVSLRQSLLAQASQEVII